MAGRMLLERGRIFDTDTACFMPAEMLIEDGMIAAIGAPGTLSRDGALILDADGALVAPGLVDIHTHGRAGGDFNSADVPLLRKMARSYLDAGVTTVMPTLASAPLDSFGEAADRIATVAEAAPVGARLIGLHLEGRYLNPKKRGAHAAELVAPLDGDELTALVARMRRGFGGQCPFRIAAALELDADGSFTRAALAAGLKISLGPTEATYAQALAAVRAGANCFTHLYNAMSPLHHRAGGAPLACFDSGAFGEVICDGFHIAPEMVGLANLMLGVERLVLNSDSMEGTGCPDGDYTIAGLPVTVRDGKAYTIEGNIAGSTLDLLQGVCNLAKFCDIPFSRALLCATVNPARAAGIDHMVGSLRVGLHADFLLLDERQGEIVLRDAYVGGVCMTGVAE